MLHMSILLYWNAWEEAVLLSFSSCITFKETILDKTCNLSPRIVQRVPNEVANIPVWGTHSSNMLSSSSRCARVATVPSTRLPLMTCRTWIWSSRRPWWRGAARGHHPLRTPLTSSTHLHALGQKQIVDWMHTHTKNQDFLTCDWPSVVFWAGELGSALHSKTLSVYLLLFRLWMCLIIFGHFF